MANKLHLLVYKTFNCKKLALRADINVWQTDVNMIGMAKYCEVC